MTGHSRMLIIAAHPDDEVLGCGGTIARLAKEGHKVHIAILGEGATSRYKKREKADQTAVETLRAQAQQVATVLGAQDVLLHGLPDNRFDTIPLLDIVKIIEELVEKIKPQAIYTHHGGDLNIDHAIVHRAVLTAVRPVAGCPVKEVYAFEVPSSTEWNIPSPSTCFAPSCFIDITGTLKHKIAALKEYKTEIRPFPHPRSLQGVKIIAQRWGMQCGVAAAEAFEIMRLIR